MDIDDAKRRILEQVADGSLTPAEGADRLTALDADARGEDGGAEETDPAGRRTQEPSRDLPEFTPSNGIRRVRINGTFRPVHVVADPDISTAVVSGSHQIEQEGDILVVNADLGLSLEDDDDFDDDFDEGATDWFQFRRHGRGAYRMRMGPRVMRMRSAGGGLEVRMNPNLDLDAKIDAGPLTINGVRGAIRARVAAGPLKINEFAGPLDLHVAAGPIKARGRLTTGESRIQCEAGSVKVQLLPGSNVTVRAAATLGKVHFSGSDPVHDRDRDRDRDRDEDEGNWSRHWELGSFIDALGREREGVFGSGDADLEIAVQMGSVHISGG